MINYNPKNWFSFIFSFHKSDTARILWKELIYIGILTSIIAYVQIHVFPNADYLKNLTTVYSLLGFVISLLLVFRTNTAYDRWWEGRRMWGSMVNDSRNFVSKISVMDLSLETRKRIGVLVPLFSFSVKEHLRSNRVDGNVLIGDEEKKSFAETDHQPLWVIKELRELIQGLKNQGKMDNIELNLLNQNLDRLVDSLGACERIRNTPIPFSYSLFIKKFIFIYVVTMPLAFVEIFGYYAVFISTFVFYALVSMELLAEEIEDPFGTDENDLPTDALCDTIRRNTESFI
ncbi:MAG: bestrophin family protein [Crocinitomicaceae bacterium]